MSEGWNKRLALLRRAVDVDASSVELRGGPTRQTVAAYEGGERERASLDVLWSIATALGIDGADLVAWVIEGRAIQFVAPGGVVTLRWPETP